MKAIRIAEWVIAVSLTAAVVVLLIARAQHAGGLWRDECASVQVAEMPTIGGLFENFQRESFPAFFYLALRGYTKVFGAGDVALRALGFAVGILLLAVCWINSTLLQREPPLISIALLGLNTSILIWGTTIRGYGIGSALILLAFGLIGRAFLEPTRARIALAFCVALASVQVLLYNPVLLLAIGGAAAIVSFSRRKQRAILVVLGMGLLCAISMVPYLGPFWQESHATIVFQAAIGLDRFWSQLQLAFGNPLNVMTIVWCGLFILAIAAGAARLWSIRITKPFPDWDLLLFGWLAAVFSLIGYLSFLQIVSYGTREWYYLALLSILAGAIDLIVALLSRTRWIRVLRLTFAGAALVALPFFAWPEVVKRQTNIDLIATKLETMAKPNDLIVANPWYYGVSLNRYYHGSTRWVTVPQMNDHRVHRFDLLKERMMSPNAIEDLYPLMQSALESGNRVWFVGGVWFLPAGEIPPSLPPAPNPQYGWNLDLYSALWSQQIGVFLRNHASGGELIPIQTNGPVSPLERVDLLVLSGRHE